jgi:triacylglycerol lipase
VISVFLGSRYGPNNGFSTDWQPNDGVVNTISMLHDSTGKAVWNKMAQLSNMDHTAVMGITLLTEVLELYSAHAKLLLSLPLASSRRQLAEEADTDAAATKITAAITSLNAAASSAKTVQNLQSLCESPANDFAEAYCTNMLVGAAGAARHLRG